MNVEEDGITHVNIYSQGKTKLGKWLSNFSHTPIDTEDGHFESIEGYWYWLVTDNINKDILRGLYGYEAKKTGRELRGSDWQESDEFKNKICKAIKTKIKSNQEMFNLLKDNKLPLVHYYVFNGFVKEPKEGKWIIDYISSLTQGNKNMIKKFLVVGDNHLDSMRPASRLDNYMEAGLMELTETLKIAKAAGVDYYILLGDVFNRIEVGGECRNRTIEILKSNEGEDWGFEKFLVVGNHDIAHNPNNMEKSAVQALVSAGVVKCVDTIPDLPVRFFHFTPDLDQRLRDGELANYDEKIMFMHASISDKAMIFDHVLFNDLVVNPQTKLIFSGHIHRHMTAEKPGVKFFNPGSLGRPEISPDFEKHKVSVILFHYDFDTDNLKHRTVELKYSLPYDVIFDLERNKQRKSDDKNTELFIETVTNLSLADSLSGNLTEDLILFAQKRNITSDVSDMAVNTIKLIKTGGEL